MHVETIEASAKLGHAMNCGAAKKSFLDQQLASIKLPFSAGKNSEDLNDVAWRNQAFLQRYGLLQGDTRLRHDIAGFVQYATLLYPSAEDAALDVAVDAITWANLWRYEYERLSVTDAPVANIVLWQLIDLTLHRVGIQPNDDATPWVWAFANLWKREAAGMSLSWQQRAATNWRRWFLSFAGEGVLPDCDSDSTLSTRMPDRWSVECAVLGDLIEGSHASELPRGTHESLEIEGLRDIQADSMRWVSDIAAACAGSLPEDNMVRRVRQGDMSTEQAVRKVIVMHEQLMQRWCRLRGRLSRLYTTLHLNEDARIRLQRYVIGIEAMIAGHHAWHVGIRRKK